MFAKLAVISSLAILAVATPTPSEQSNQCNTGSVQCCNSVQSANSTDVAPLLSLLGIAVQDVTGQVGLTCNPISILGVSDTSCSTQPVCCTDNKFNGLIALGCTPINANL